MKKISISFTNPTFEKDKWADGAWQQEPDKKQWVDEKTNLPCLIVRAHHGALCGYVGVGTSHPFYGEDYYGLPCEVFDVHGGLTYSAFSDTYTDDNGCAICYEGDLTPQDEVEEKIWWFGFDCAHLGDICPRKEYWEMISGMNATYKDMKYVEDQVEELASQLYQVSKVSNEDTSKEKEEVGEVGLVCTKEGCFPTLDVLPIEDQNKIRHIIKKFNEETS